MLQLGGPPTRSVPHVDDAHVSRIHSRVVQSTAGGTGRCSRTGVAVPVTNEQELESLRQQLAQAQRMAALGELTSTTTHEFNNVLMTILNYARMGLRHKDEATRDKALDKIFAAAQRAAKITSTMLAVARNRSGAFEPTDLKQIVD